MRVVLCLLLIIALCFITVDSQSARGNDIISSSSDRYRSNTRTGTACYGAHCHRAGIIAGSVIGGIFVLLAIVFLIIYYYHRRRVQPSESNLAFLNQNSTNEQHRTYQTYEDNCFKNGIWKGRYYQYDRWHEPGNMTLSFDPKSERVTGHGYDDVGKFTIDGTFFTDTQRIAMIKVYQLGTGNSQENFGHAVNLQSTWNPNQAQFEGKWFVQIDRYRDEDKFELKLEKTTD